ncbi:MAG: ABC transporter substrate-binding protein [Promethearchaeota archaeon]|nr:MAG: ABC transporter substrate-binding protein [Candidatus Lokiarchaeota archaeon]
MYRKSIRLSYLLIGLLILSAANLRLFFPSIINNSIDLIDEKNSQLKPSELVYDPFIVGINSYPNAIDPVDAFGPGEYYVIDQVCEGLFRYNISDPNNPRINWLAESYWWEDKTTLHIKLREGILFHDQYSFNSTAVKWNLERVNYLTNATGLLPGGMNPAYTDILWKFPNGTGIMDQIDTVGIYNITIHLKAPYAPFIDLLSHSSAYMISPHSHSPTDYIDYNTDDLIGTGPFEYDVFNTTTEEIEFHAFENYWRGVANITKMEFSIITDPVTRNNAMLGGAIDFLCGPSPTYYSSLIADPDITFSEAPTPSFVYRYIVMNNEYINRTWRKAISYAINYTYIIKEILNDRGIPAYSPISVGFGDGYYNCSDIAPYLNLTLARQTLIDAGITSLAVDDDAGWQAADLITIDYTYYTISSIGSTLYPFLTNELDKIGVTIQEDAYADYIPFVMRISQSTNANLCWLGWGADYLDPYNTLSPLFYDTSSANYAFVNNSWINSKLDEALATLDDSARDAIYHDIQINVSSYLYPHLFISNDQVFFAHNVNLTYFPYNGLQKLDFYSCEWIPTYTYIPETLPTIIINSPTDNQGFSSTAPTFSLTIIAPDYDTIWYTLDDGVTNITCSILDQVDPTLWAGLGDNPYTLRFYANRTSGLIGTAAVSIYKDTIDPVLVINEPDSGDEFTTTIPIYDITITDDHLATYWYTLEGGTPIPTTTLSGSIDETAWNALPNGQVNITFYAIDYAGNIGFSYILVNKNAPTPPPEIPGAYTLLILMILFAGIISLTWVQKRKLK